MGKRDRPTIDHTQPTLSRQHPLMLVQAEAFGTLAISDLSWAVILCFVCHNHRGLGRPMSSHIGSGAVPLQPIEPFPKVSPIREPPRLEGMALQTG